jgi:glycine dehydrogenase subunit 1
MHMTLLGETGLARLAELNHAQAVRLETKLKRVKGTRVLGNSYFNEFALYLGDGKDAAAVVDALADRGILGGVPAARFYPEWPELRPILLLAATETNSESDMDALVAALSEVL